MHSVLRLSFTVTTTFWWPWSWSTAASIHCRNRSGDPVVGSSNACANARKCQAVSRLEFNGYRAQGWGIECSCSTCRATCRPLAGGVPSSHPCQYCDSLSGTDPSECSGSRWVLLADSAPTPTSGTAPIPASDSRSVSASATWSTSAILFLLSPH